MMSPPQAQTDEPRSSAAARRAFALSDDQSGAVLAGCAVSMDSDCGTGLSFIGITSLKNPQQVAITHLIHRFLSWFSPVRETAEVCGTGRNAADGWLIHRIPPWFTSSASASVPKRDRPQLQRGRKLQKA